MRTRTGALRRALVLSTTCLLPVLGACAGPGSSRLEEEVVSPSSSSPSRASRDSSATVDTSGAHAVRASHRVPAWAGGETGPGRLEELESWLRGEGRSYQGYWRIEADLQASEARLQLGRAQPEESTYHRLTARQGFERVIADPQSTTAQRQRAEFGLEATDGLPAARDGSNVLAAGILPRARWGARPAVGSRMDTARDPWRWITIHHSAMPDAPRPDGTLRSSASALRQIQAAHMNGEGFGDVGYHFLIDSSGRVFAGRDLRYQGAHAGGANNRGNIGVCLLGNFQVERPSRAAVAALDRLVEGLRVRYSIARERVQPHRHWKNTECPGRHLIGHLERYH